MITIDIAVASNKYQSPDWWAPLVGNVVQAVRRSDVAIGQIIVKPSAVPDHNKNSIVEYSLGHRREGLTDENRNGIIRDHLAGKADFIYWLDDDTVHPTGALVQMLSLHRPMVSGLYYNKRPPCNPIAYLRQPNGGYRPLWTFDPGELVEVDSIGMGCALIHRSVFEGIRDTHDVYQRPNFSLRALPKSLATKGKNLARYAGKVVDGFYVEPYRLVSQDEMTESALAWPFYVLEYGRTEDHYFCEMAATAGFRPLVDTSINCEHWGERPVTRSSYNEFKEKQQWEERNAGA